MNNTLCMIIKDTVKPNFLNIRTSIKAYDRDALCCGAPCWRWVYHALHSADKWFFNPNVYEEPSFHEEGMDNPDNPTSVILTDEQLLAYLDQIEEKTYRYLDSLMDEMLYEKPENCRTGKFPMWVSEADKYVDDGIFFGRYRKGQVKP